MPVSKTEAVRYFLDRHAPPDLAALYTSAMELQVSVGQDGGEKVDGEYRGRQYASWTDGLSKWKNFRIPLNANSEPEDNDGPMLFDLEAHVEGIGLTGWDWKNRVSKWVGFDFDAIAGHAESHRGKLSDAELAEVRRKAQEVPWVTTRKSTGGNGLHLYVFLDNVPTANHSEHAALARAVLGQMSASVGYDFQAKVDACVPADSWTLTDEGPRRVGELVGKPTTLIVQGRPHLTDGFFQSGVEEVFEVRTKEGHVMRATGRHPLLVNTVPGSRDRRSVDVWRDLSTLAAGDRVNLSRHMGVSWPGEGTREEGYILGWLFGDGEHQAHWADRGRAGYMPKHALLKSPPAPRHDPATDAYALSSREVETLRLRFGVGPEKAITPAIEAASSDFTVGFLQAFFDADAGNVKGPFTISLTQSDEARLLAVQRMLLRLGINSRVGFRRAAGQGQVLGREVNLKAKYALTIGRENVRAFHDRVGFTHPAKRATVESNLASARKALCRDHFHATVVSVEPVGVQPVYDVSVPSAEAFDANGFHVHNCGHILWVWHRKSKGTDGLRLLKKGGVLTTIPPDWRDHLPVVAGRRARTMPQVLEVSDTRPDKDRLFDELTGQQVTIALDADHERLINFLREKNAPWSWNSDHHMLTTHTYWLKEAHQALGLKGPFDTISTGREKSTDLNSFMFPIRNGAWVVRRYGNGGTEAPTWGRDRNGYLKCFLNREPELPDAARANGATEHKAGGFAFHRASAAIEAAKSLGADVSLPPWAEERPAKLNRHKDGRLVLEFERLSWDRDEGMEGWNKDGKTWHRILDSAATGATPPPQEETGNYDSLIRHLVSERREDAGWVVHSDRQWRKETKDNTRDVLVHLGVKKGEVASVMGSCIQRAWTLVKVPFGPEYLGDRLWNRDAPKLKFTPSTDRDRLHYPHWTAILDHVGRGLDDAAKRDPWCRENGITTGGEYLKVWVASLFQFPLRPLPYLFLYSREQNTGKSIFAEALERVIDNGVVKAKQALMSASGFNGELESKVLCTVEEGDLKGVKGAYERIKEWSNSPMIQIHAKGQTPYQVVNATHWVHTSNDPDGCPIDRHDSRITMVQVFPLREEEIVPKEAMFRALDKEAPDFLASVLNLEVPETKDRLNVPILNTEQKEAARRRSQSALHLFLEEHTHDVPGAFVRVAELQEKFHEWLDLASRGEWTRKRITAEMDPTKHPKGRRRADSQWCYGNLSWSPADPLPGLVARGDTLVPAFEVEEAT